MPYRKTWPTDCRSRFAISSAPRFSTLRRTASTSGASISAMGREPISGNTSRDYLKRTFEEVGGYDELVVLRDIRVVSFCEHHMLPVIGRAHVGYLPTNRVVGISKLARVVYGFGRRLQIQEKLTAEIAEAIQDILEPQGLGVGIEATHR